MEEPKKRTNGLPICHLEILYLLEMAGGTLEKTLKRTTYSYGIWK